MLPGRWAFCRGEEKGLGILVGRGELSHLQAVPSLVSGRETPVSDGGEAGIVDVTKGPEDWGCGG